MAPLGSENAAPMGRNRSHPRLQGGKAVAISPNRYRKLAPGRRGSQKIRWLAAFTALAASTAYGLTVLRLEFH